MGVPGAGRRGRVLVRGRAVVHSPAMAVHALYPSHRSLAVKVRAFIDALAEHLGAAAPARNPRP